MNKVGVTVTYPSAGSVRWTTILGTAGIVAFVALTILVQVRLTAALDVAAADAKQSWIDPLFDGYAAAVSIALSAELSVVYAAIAGLLLWRAGLGRWALAPFAFLFSVPIEVILKIVVAQPWVPSEFYRNVYYPLATLTLRGTYPSGHAIRGAFFCAFLALLLGARRGSVARLAPILLTLLAITFGLTRIYLGYHWLSDVVAGMLLGVALAFFVTPPTVDRLAYRSHTTSG